MGDLTCAELTLGSYCLFSHNHNLMNQIPVDVRITTALG